ncbi:hypothetical protein GP486_001196 [Trichoglossum hirsutum]|uniref:LYC1 C-terminal domain-containing protein n=1 Tax=Trichoglossum hirsutum TaxID=265104 RepID=A0A9P8LGG4_9PEZI|nr:hypothetical protein GP486_001196 [Trichoglossum hirsutum]
MPPPSAVTHPFLADIAVTPQLPDAESPTLRLLHPTFAEKKTIWKQNAQAWCGALSVPAYLRREQRLSETSLTRNGGMTHWVLVDTSQPFEGERRILASCESIRKRALVAFECAEGTRVEEVVSHGIGSVFCPKEFRGKGYARRMMRELGKILKDWQVEQGSEKCLFTVLYSDIGKKFYASHGWHPFASSHISLSPMPKNFVGGTSTLPPSREIYATSLRGLCAADECLLTQRLSAMSTNNRVHVAFVPDLESMEYHHAREEFIARELVGREPTVKGAIVGDAEGQKAWCIWTRVYDGKDELNPATTLYILRLVVEGEEFINGASLVHGTNMKLARSGVFSGTTNKQVDAVSSLLLAAQREASRWGMKDIRIWNPGPITVLAAHRVLNLTSDSTETPVVVVDREKESITSLMWYGESQWPWLEGLEWKDIEWICNERYAWC